MNFDIIICTKNRVNELSQCLYSLNKTKNKYKGSSAWSVIIVNDGEDFNLELKKYHLLNIKKIESSKSGLSDARNIGVENSESEIIIFIDDDAFVRENFMEKIEDSWNKDKFKEVAVICGEPKSLILENSERVWFDEQCKIFKPIAYMYSVDLLISKDRVIIPKGMGVIEAVVSCRRESLGSHRFNSKLGRSNDLLLSGEGILFEIISRENGKQMIYDPSIVVDHLIDSNRLNKNWIINRIFWQGVTETILYRMGYRKDISLHKSINVEYLSNKEIYLQAEEFHNILNLGRAAGIYFKI
jgi:glycosyltransferase involved in cell wall biosynthesis